MRGRTDKQRKQPAQTQGREQQGQQPRPAQTGALEKLLAVVIGGRNEPTNRK